MKAWRVLRSVLLFPWTMLKAVAAGFLAVLLALLTGCRHVLLSVRVWVVFLLLLLAAIVGYYALADRYTPLTTDAYVQAYVTQVAPQVEGRVVRVHVGESQAVKKGDLL